MTSYSIRTADGTVLTSSTDLGLAWAWAEHESGDAWSGLLYSEQCRQVADALAELRRAAGSAS